MGINWAIVDAIVATLTLLIVVCGGVFFYGRLVQKVEGQGESILRLEDAQQAIWEKVGQQGESISALTGLGPRRKHA